MQKKYTGWHSANNQFTRWENSQVADDDVIFSRKRNVVNVTLSSVN